LKTFFFLSATLLPEYVEELKIEFQTSLKKGEIPGLPDAECVI